MVEFSSAVADGQASVTMQLVFFSKIIKNCSSFFRTFESLAQASLFQHPLSCCRLNAVREVCVRCPLAMSEELLRDLTTYKSYQDKSVMMAARSLIHLYRDLNPDMLHRKDRVRAWLGCGLEASMLDSLIMYGLHNDSVVRGV
jgi:hypothetical protein